MQAVLRTEGKYKYKPAALFSKMKKKDRFTKAEIRKKVQEIVQRLGGEDVVLFLDQTKFAFPPFQRNFWHSKDDLRATLADLRPGDQQVLEANCCYALGKGFEGVVFSEQPSDSATITFFLSQVVEHVWKKYRSRKMTIILDNLAAHSKAERLIKESLGKNKAFRDIMLYNLPGMSMLNAIENAFSSVKLRFYGSGLNINQRARILQLFDLPELTITNLARNYLGYLKKILQEEPG